MEFKYQKSEKTFIFKVWGKEQGDKNNDWFPAVDPQNYVNLSRKWNAV